jgi:hypothetical protein
MRRWILGCGIVGGLLAITLVVCIVTGLIGLSRVSESLPTPRPRPTLTIGETYWIGALVPPPGIFGGLVVRDATLCNKPGDPISDASVTIITFLSNATPVKLIGIRDEWCYIGATDEYGQHFEGWTDCERLLDYEPTPMPTPNPTPERP